MTPNSSGRVVLLSIDGMNPAVYRASGSAHRFPNLLELERTGASAEAVETIYPSTTYPAHATIVTGVAPRAHGVYSHLASLDPTEPARPWHWYSGVLRAPAIWDVARASRRRTAALSWPVSAGAPIDSQHPRDLESRPTRSAPRLRHPRTTLYPPGSLRMLLGFSPPCWAKQTPINCAVRPHCICGSTANRT